MAGTGLPSKSRQFAKEKLNAFENFVIEHRQVGAVIALNSEGHMIEGGCAFNILEQFCLVATH